MTPGTYQAVLGDAQDHLAVEVSAAEMLGDGQPAQAVAGVVEIPGSGGGYWGAERGAGVPGGPPSPMPAPSWYSLARLVEQPAGRALAAQEDVFLQRRLVEHPVRRAERRVAWGGGGELGSPLSLGAFYRLAAVGLPLEKGSLGASLCSRALHLQ